MDFVNHGLWYGAVDGRPNRRYIVRKDGKHWTAEMLATDTTPHRLIYSYGALSTKKEAIEQCEEWADEARAAE